MERTIVVGVDGSDTSRHALAWAGAVARRIGARIQPVSAWDYPAVAVLPFPAGLPVPPEDAMQADHEAGAAMTIESTTGLAGVDVLDPIVARGSGGRVLCDAAIGADLLVVGSRGLGAIKSLVMGSVSGYCVNHAPCPVAVVPPTWEIAPDGVVPPTRIVAVGVDGSPHSDAAVAWADAWAPEDATLALLHSWDVPVTVDGAAIMYRMEDLEEVARQVGERALGQVSQARRDAGTVDLRVVRTDARLMLEEAGEQADLLVIGARGHRGLERMLLGSVASHTVHHLTTPTVVVHADVD